MSKFDAGSAVEAMEWDFTKFGGGKGLVPEPTTGQVTTFFDSIKAMAKEVQALRGRVDNPDIEAEEAADILSSMEDGMIERFNDNITTQIAALCSDSPSVEDIRLLPYRVMASFQTWITGQIRPE